MEHQYDETGTAGTEAGRTSGSASSSNLPLLDDEDVLIDTRPAWSAWGLHLVFAAVLTLAGLALRGFEGVFVILMGVSVAGYVWYRRRAIRYLVTDRRVVVVTGISTKTTNETWMEDVRGMQTGASIFERLLGHGSITVSHAVIPRSFSRFSGLRLAGVPEYEAVADTIRTRQSQRKAVDY